MIRTTLTTIGQPLLAAAAFAALLAPAPCAQSIDRVVPEAASPGDVVTLRGTGLGATTVVAFTATIGGIPQTSTIVVTPFRVSHQSIHVVVPFFGTFTPGDPAATGSSPMGSVTVPGAAARTFVFLEGTFGQTKTVGTATTPSIGSKPVISLDPASGVPKPGNPTFVAKLENGIPGLVALLGIAAPAAPPLFPVGDGTLVLDAANAFALLGPIAIDANGVAVRNVPIPASAGIVAAMQWIEIDFGLPGLLAVSNAFQIVL